MRHLPSTDDRARRIEERFEWPMIVAALLVIPALVIEGSDFGDPWPLIGDVLNWTIWLAFLLELVVMLRVVPDRGRWLRDHPLEVAVVLLTPPFLPASLQAARVFRLLRVIRLLALASRLRLVISSEDGRRHRVRRVAHRCRGRADHPRRDAGDRGRARDGREGPTAPGHEPRELLADIRRQLDELERAVRRSEA
ncbi:MAG: hypothetical protein AVDCRST_MAG85-4022 [uncultured Solirubrobacteraceae bacterium]|uniref:Ion transport domain-containing protein n=1 Tax=uncultured Solirubrobacteraceae bacterium TaxID=1162706 RepID=A0A6J4TYA8_9ACTN|nr:MAG: hypothetical protein AVDCRST_MAG85-4022 [uncultured Solirubrobacteraceae bacterium]